MASVSWLTTSSSTTNTFSNSSASSNEVLYTMSECVFQVSLLPSQRALLGFMGTSLVINFGIFIWWLRMYRYKRKLRSKEEQAVMARLPDASRAETPEGPNTNIGMKHDYKPYSRPAYGMELEEKSLNNRPLKQPPGMDDASIGGRRMVQSSQERSGRFKDLGGGPPSDDYKMERSKEGSGQPMKASQHAKADHETRSDGTRRRVDPGRTRDLEAGP